jgi:pterin-4a-carbinolamine dehydratase
MCVSRDWASEEVLQAHSVFRHFAQSLKIVSKCAHYSANSPHSPRASYRPPEYHERLHHGATDTLQ